MMWKKGVALLFGLMLVATTLSFGKVMAEDTSVTVILVSDNEADCALAQYLANVTGAVVVTTTWGVYDPNVTAEIMSYAPDEVIIIGGPDAVVEQYVADLEELGITVERWGGQNRYETNLMVMEQAKLKFKLMFNNSVIITPGNDSAAIRAALRMAVRRKAMIAFVNDTSNITKLMLKLQLRNANVTIVQTPVMSKVMLHIREQLREKMNCNCTEMEVNITAETALEAINASEERITTAKEMLENVTLSPPEERLATRMLNLAEKELENAKDAYEMGRYGKAYGQAIAAKAHAEFVIRMASDRWSVEIQTNMTMRAEMYVWRLERQIMVMEKSGFNTTELRALVDQLKEAIKNGDYDAIDSIMQQIREKLLELYANGRGKFRERMVFPAHGRHGRP
ncbi:hypothetical protein [Thermococcus thioreducens]|uniref:Putative cell wall-binding protein n=1 Tax=Thermococcus thioreducens TaxID=277988 RepID=A0A0Q2QR45_9EURY|nr:hypothetical protein [Thermococcus thioreducens]ASJ12538.1 hypothetical protein A3L14_06370 [Thermococcus thioreducens]KQH82461.1 hypothetical protein AMR53_05870 [Thermococcus thioreducens]SEV89159.1 Putative cell wall-binding protein [Thermococcus thioreducens]